MKNQRPFSISTWLPIAASVIVLLVLVVSAYISSAALIHPSVTIAQTCADGHAPPEDCAWFNGVLRCVPGDCGVTGGCTPSCTGGTLNCPDGYTGSITFTQCVDMYCQNTETQDNNCVPIAPSCTPSTTTDNVGCNGPGTHTITTTTNADCTTSTTDNNNCTTCPSNTSWDGTTCVAIACTGPSTTTDVGCPAGYTGTHLVTTSCDGTVTNDTNNCVQDPTTQCPDPTTTDVGCPAGYEGTNMVTVWYTNPPACTRQTSSNNQCVQVSSDATMTITENIGGAWSVSPAGLSGSTSGTYTVHPSSSGTLYTITPGFVSGYAYPPTVDNTVTGSGSSYMLFPGQTAGFIITYTPTGQSFDYTLSNSGNATIMKGGRDTFGQTTINKTLVAGNSQSTDLTVTGVPANVGYTMANATCSPTCSSTITFTVHPSAAAGTYHITVNGTGGKNTSFDLIIQDSPNIIVSCTASPSTAFVGQQVTWNSSVSGGVPPYSYVWSGTNVPTTPAPTTQSFNITYSTVGAKNAQVHIIDSLSNVGACDGVAGDGPVGSIQINFNPQFHEF